MIKRFRVEQKDGDTYFLVDLGMTEEVHAKGGIPLADGFLPNLKAKGALVPNAVSTGLWAKASTRLKVGSIVEGTFDFDPKESLQRMAFPTFTPTK